MVPATLDDAGTLQWASEAVGQTVRNMYWPLEVFEDLEQAYLGRRTSELDPPIPTGKGDDKSSMRQPSDDLLGNGSRDQHLPPHEVGRQTGAGRPFGQAQQEANCVVSLAIDAEHNPRPQTLTLGVNVPTLSTPFPRELIVKFVTCRHRPQGRARARLQSDSGIGDKPHPGRSAWSRRAHCRRSSSGMVAGQERVHLAADEAGWRGDGESTAFLRARRGPIPPGPAGGTGTPRAPARRPHR